MKHNRNKDIKYWWQREAPVNIDGMDIATAILLVATAAFIINATITILCK